MIFSSAGRECALTWMWAKARSKLGALIRPCGDGVVSNAARVGSFCMEINPPLQPIICGNGPFRPTTALQMPKVGVPASPWMWAKARSKLGALIRPCGDGVVSNAARVGSFCMEIIHPFCTLCAETDRSDPPLHCRCPKLVFPPRHGCGRRPEAN
jgi:hypothetical protein